MNSRDLIESGIIELYVLGIAGDDDRALVETLALEDSAVRHEIALVNDALALYAGTAGSIAPDPGLKNKILSFIESSSSQLPPRLTADSTVEEWTQYLDEHQMKAPQNFEGIFFLELPSTEEFYTYAVWGRSGDFVDEESHSNHNEYLFICKGECEMTIGGKKTYHKAGDFLEITPGVPHSAVVTGKEMMLVIGQRRAA